MKKQIALILAGTAAVIAGYLRLVQDLIDRGQGSGAESDGKRDPEIRVAGAPEATNGSGPIRVSGSASKADLYAIATKLKINGRSKMSKAELIKAINSAG
jgi:hypothetical protein